MWKNSFNYQIITPPYLPFPIPTVSPLYQIQQSLTSPLYLPPSMFLNHDQRMNHNNFLTTKDQGKATEISKTHVEHVFPYFNDFNIAQWRPRVDSRFAKKL